MVRAKFKVISKQSDPSNGTTISLFPVISGSAENEQFYKWTPSGQVQLNTVNDLAAEQFIVGKEYYVDFTPAD